MNKGTILAGLKGMDVMKYTYPDGVCVVSLYAKAFGYKWHLYLSFVVLTGSI